MIAKLADYLSQKFYTALEKQPTQKNLSRASLDLYRYATELALTTLFQALIIASLSFLFDVVTESLLYVLSFSSLRLFAGGIHAKTHFRCALFYNLVHFLSIGIALQIKSDTLAGVILLVASVAAFIIIFRYAPVASKNKPLLAREIHKYRKISRILFIIQFTLSGSLYFLALLSNNINLLIYPLCIGLAYFIESLTLLPVFHPHDIDDK